LAARSPANSIEVEFADGEKVVVRIGDGETIACGLCYQEGMPQAEYGRLAIEAAENHVQRICGGLRVLWTVDRATHR